MTESMPSGPTITAAAPPYVDCIQWIPRRFAAGISPLTIVDLVFRPRVLADIGSRVASAREAPAFGAIVGRIFEDPTCDRRWGRVEGIIASASPPAEDAGAEALGAALDALDGSDSREGESIALGWYRSHVATGLYLSPEEARFHEERFPDPWGFALILAGAAERRSGGVFQRTAPEGLSRSAYTPFYELSPAAAGRETTPRPTVIAWQNYQTESRVVHVPDAVERPGAARAADTGAAETRTVATIPELEAGGDAGPAPGPDAGRPTGNSGGAAGAPARPAKDRSRRKNPVDGLPLLEDGDPDWEKVQIQRSLTAVGRTLGPSTIGQLGAPGRREAPAVERAPPGEDDELVVPPAPVPRAEPGLEPVRTLAGEGDGLVGRARRRGGLPVRRIAVAAAGFALMAAAGWVGTRMLADPAAGDGDAASAASVGLAPGDLRGRGDAAPPSDGEPPTTADPDLGEAALAVGFEPDSGDVLSATGGDPATGGRDGDRGAPDTPAGTAGIDSLETAGDPAPEAEGTDAYDEGGAPPIPAPRPPEIIEAPDRSSVILDDPAVSAYENALSIFRAEIERYEATRDEFDEGLATCNPLNLSFRGVLDAHSRLLRRHEDAFPRLSEASMRAHEVAEGQFAMTRTHYELTDCPMPIGD